MKVEHIHTMPFMERMMLSGWMGPFMMMAAMSAKRAERLDQRQERADQKEEEEKKKKINP